MKFITIYLLLIATVPVFAQRKMPVIKATSMNVSIRDDGFLDKNAWTLSPKTRPDVYVADRTHKTKYVTFITDIDSIRVKVNPGTRFNFVILFNGTDSCYTQIASAIPPEEETRGEKAKSDTIPFILNDNNAIQVKALINDNMPIDMHFDLGSLGFSLTRDALATKLKAVKVASLQMGTLKWDTPAIKPVAVTAAGMDGKFGWQLFEGKTVEINYDTNVIIIRSGMPNDKRGYIKADLEFIRSYICINAAFIEDNRKYAGDFMFDTGSDEAIILDGEWMKKQNFPKGLKLIKSTVLLDPRGNHYESKIVQMPGFIVGGSMLRNPPALVLGDKNPAGFELNFMGNDLLKRFNLILDFKNDVVYFKPNQLMKLKYRENS